jgi:hypothetical protein
MTPVEGDKNFDTARSKCAHPSCKCLLSANRPHGDLRSDMLPPWSVGAPLQGLPDAGVRNCTDVRP